MKPPSELRRGRGTLIDAVDEDILKAVRTAGQTTISSLASRLGWSKSMVWRRLRKLQRAGLVMLERAGGVVIVRPVPGAHAGLRLGIPRASEYPYLPRFVSYLRSLYNEVSVTVYDNPFSLAVDMVQGKIDAGFMPAPTAILMHRASGGAIFIAGGGSGGGAGIVEGPQGEGHATTMASTMELCATIEKLPPPRVYASSGDEILNLVEKGVVRYGVVWEPYLTIARDKGFRVTECNLPFCCLLTVRRSLEDDAGRIAEVLEKAVSEALRGLADLDAYSAMVGLPAPLVKRTVSSYRLLEEPPYEDIKRLWPALREALVPGQALDSALH